MRQLMRYTRHTTRIWALCCQLSPKRKYCKDAYWSHTGESGPENWHKWYPKAKGACQSPIALYSGSEHKSLELCLSGYKNPIGLTACNTGSTVSFKSSCDKKDKSPWYITGAHGWWEKYTFDHMHWHWGPTSEDGSEHTIDDKRFPMELHIVHALGNLSVAQACNRPKGLAVLGFMYEISNEDNTAYAALLEAMKHVTYKGQEKEVVSSSSLTIASLLPPTLDTGYFYYSGSLTTPPCSEVVQWMVFSDPIAISERQMEIFRSLHRCPEPGCIESMSGNWRPLQERNNREVYQSKTIAIRTD